MTPSFPPTTRLKAQRHAGQNDELLEPDGDPAYGDRSTDQERTPIAAHEGVLAGGIDALCEHAPAPGSLGAGVVPVSVVRVPHAGSTSALTVADTARFGAPVGWWPW